MKIIPEGLGAVAPYCLTRVAIRTATNNSKSSPKAMIMISTTGTDPDELSAAVVDVVVLSSTDEVVVAVECTTGRLVIHARKNPIAEVHMTKNSRGL